VTPGFVPNVFVDISEQIEKKLEAFNCFSLQVKEFPNERSIETLRALATLRGSTVGVSAGEAFYLIRRMVRPEDTL